MTRCRMQCAQASVARPECARRFLQSAPPLALSTTLPALLLKCLLGAAAVLVIALLSRTRSFYVAGLVPLFPTFALIAHYIVGSERGVQDLRTTALFGLWSLAPYAVYLLCVYGLAGRLSLWPTLLGATLAWFACAAVLLLAWQRWMPA